MRPTSICTILTLFWVAGCAIAVDGQALPSSTSAKPLPFTPSIAERTNDRNDGTTFEPCVAYSAGEIEQLGSVYRSVSDAGFSDSPNFRGCNWDTPGNSGQLGQIVGNESSLANYKAKQSNRPWQPDRQIGGRTVIATAEPHINGCYASFMSQKAIVHSSYRTTSAGVPSPGLVEECDKAIAFATLAISKAPR